MTQTALITGASSGIGLDIAHELASRGYDLIVVSEDAERLEKAASGLRAKHQVQVDAIAKDLAQTDAASALYDEITGAGREVDVLVNDAGVGQRGNFVETSLDEDLTMTRLNVEALMVLSKRFGKDMVARDRGRILNLGSVAGFQPGPLLAVYHATKAFVVSLSEALAQELSDMDSQVTVTCLCPGPTATHFFERADMPDARATDLTMDSQTVAEKGVEAMEKGERVCVPGAMNKVLTFTRRAMSLHTQAKLNRQFYESKSEAGAEASA